MSLAASPLNLHAPHPLYGYPRRWISENLSQLVIVVETISQSWGPGNHAFVFGSDPVANKALIDTHDPIVNGTPKHPGRVKMPGGGWVIDTWLESNDPPQLVDAFEAVTGDLNNQGDSGILAYMNTMFGLITDDFGQGPAEMVGYLTYSGGAPQRRLSQGSTQYERNQRYFYSLCKHYAALGMKVLKITRVLTGAGEPNAGVGGIASEEEDVFDQKRSFAEELEWAHQYWMAKAAHDAGETWFPALPQIIVWDDGRSSAHPQRRPDTLNYEPSWHPAAIRRLADVSPRYVVGSGVQVFPKEFDDPSKPPVDGVHFLNGAGTEWAAQQARATYRKCFALEGAGAHFQMNRARPAYNKYALLIPIRGPLNATYQIDTSGAYVPAAFGDYEGYAGIIGSTEDAFGNATLLVPTGLDIVRHNNRLCLEVGFDIQMRTQWHLTIGVHKRPGYGPDGPKCGAAPLVRTDEVYSNDHAVYGSDSRVRDLPEFVREDMGEGVV